MCRSHAPGAGLLLFLVIAVCDRDSQIPRLLHPGEGTTVTSPVALSWTGVAEVTSYRVQIDTDSVFAAPRIDSLVEDTPDVVFGLHPGLHYWRVAAEYSDGRIGNYSDQGHFRVASVSYPCSVVATVPVGLAPNSLDITPDGREVWIDNSGTSDQNLYVVATDSLRVSHVIPTFGFDHGELKISPDGVFVYFDEKLVWDSGPEIGQMAEFRTSDYGFYGACACGIDMNADPTGPIGYSLACSPSGDIVVAVDSGEDEGEVYTDVCCFQVPNPGGYNSAGWVEGAMDLQFDRWNPHLYVLCWNDTLRDLDAVSMDNLRSLNLGNRTSHGMIRLSNDSRYAYITQREPPGVTVVDLTNWHVVTTLRLSAQEGTWAEALSPDGNFLYVGEGNSSIIHIADVSDPPNASWLNQVKVGNGQVRGICFAPDGSRAYVSVCPDGVAVLGLK